MRPFILGKVDMEKAIGWRRDVIYPSRRIWVLSAPKTSNKLRSFDPGRKRTIELTDIRPQTTEQQYFCWFYRLLIPSCLQNPKMFEPIIKCSGASALSSKSKCKSGAGLCFGPSFCLINFHLLPAGARYERSPLIPGREKAREFERKKKKSETKTRQKSLRCNITFRFGLSNICLEPTFTLENDISLSWKHRNNGDKLDPKPI